MEESKGLIQKKIIEVMREIEPIAKERRNDQQGYNFRGVDDVMNALGPKLSKHGIFPTTQSVVDIKAEQITSAKGTVGYRQVKRYTFRFYAEDGSFVETTTDGEAMDYGDKGSNKAYSVAYREALFKMFVIPFGNDDIENHEHEVRATSTTPKAPTVPIAPPKSVPNVKPIKPISTEPVVKAIRKMAKKDGSAYYYIDFEDGRSAALFEETLITEFVIGKSVKAYFSEKQYNGKTYLNITGVAGMEPDENNYF